MVESRLREWGGLEVMWFRAFGNEAIDLDWLADTLFRGPAPPPPDVETDTKADERDLGIEPPRVYAYLGRMVPGFGEIGLALDRNAMLDEVSPFDTGGLLRKVHPVKDWGKTDRRAFLTTFTFPASELHALLEVYPGNGGSWLSYARGERPSEPGPACLHEDADSLPVPIREAAIWAEPNHDPRSWSWEARERNRVDSKTHLREWSSSSNVFWRLVRHLEGLPDLEEKLEVLDKWVEGGPGELHRRYLAGLEGVLVA